MATGQITKVERVCEQCGDTFLIGINRVQCGGGRFCSKSCAAQRTRPGRQKRVECTCHVCGKEFVRKSCIVGKGWGRYCSVECRNRRPRPCGKAGRVCETCGNDFLVKPCEVKRQCGRFCSRDCYHRSMRIPVDRQFLDRLGPETEGDCILWVGNQSVNGYGLLTSQDKGRKRLVMAHRFAFEMAHGKIPPGMQVLHRCDTPRCVNPFCLFLGTPADNAADKVAKGRQVKGEDSHLAKVTADMVRDIRTRYAAGGVTQKQLAVEHGLSLGHVMGIIKRRSWKHID